MMDFTDVERSQEDPPANPPPVDQPPGHEASLLYPGGRVYRVTRRGKRKQADHRQQPDNRASVSLPRLSLPTLPSKEYDRLAVNSLVSGIVSLVLLALTPFVSLMAVALSFFIGIAGTVYGFRGLRSTTRRGFAIAGIVTSLVGVIVGLGLALFMLVFMALFFGAMM